MDRRPVLVGAMALFVIMVLAPAIVPHFRWFVVTRLAAGALQGLFLAAAFTAATAVVPPEHVGRAMGVVIAGFSISTGLSLPLGVLVGTVLGWQGGLLMVGGLAIVATGLLMMVLPEVPGSRLPSTSGLLRHVFGSARAGHARVRPYIVRGARCRHGLPDAVARARHRSVRTVGEHDPGGLLAGPSGGLLRGRPTR